MRDEWILSVSGHSSSIATRRRISNVMKDPVTLFSTTEEAPSAELSARCTPLELSNGSNASIRRSQSLNPDRRFGDPSWIFLGRCRCCDHSCAKKPVRGAELMENSTEKPNSKDDRTRRITYQIFSSVANSRFHSARRTIPLRFAENLIQGFQQSSEG